VFPLIEAVLKQLQIITLAKRNERTNFYISQFYHKATLSLLSVIVGVWKPSEASIERNI
jgi:hypothetical protein